MKNKAISLLLCLALVLGMAGTAFASTEAEAAEKTLKTLGIMTGDSEGNMNFDRYVTRAQLAKMLCAASVYKDTVSEVGLGYSLYSDLRSNHWASEYIRLCTQLGWMTGYSNGTFRPDATVKVEEACSAILKVLGYTTSELAGSYPYAQLSKVASLGITDNVNTARGTLLTRRDVMYMFYQMLTAKNAQGQTYANLLGYQVVNGKVNYTTVVSSNVNGPYVAETGTSLDFAPEQVFFNGKEVKSHVLAANEVYYYNKDSRTLWVYDKKDTGKLNAAQPAAMPQTMVVGGNTYQIQSPDASYELSSYGSIRKGDQVTVLLGMDDMVAAVLTGDQVNTQFYGVVLANYRTTDDAVPVNTMMVACTDGVTRTFVAPTNKIEAGKIVSVTVDGGKVTVVPQSKRSIEGKVNKAGTVLGDHALAENVNIIDTEGTTVVSVDAEDLAGAKLYSDNVLFYAKNGDQVTDLILKNATGNTWQYGYLLNAIKVDMMMNLTGSYTYVMNGSYGNITLNSIYNLEEGGFAVQYDANKEVSGMKQLAKVIVTDVSGSFAFAGNTKYDMDENVQVYLKSDDNYLKIEAKDLDMDKYQVKGYYDDFGCPAGGKIRVLVAEKKL